MEEIPMKNPNSGRVCDLSTVIKEVVFASKDSHKVSQCEIFVLCRLLLPIQDVRMSFPKYLIDYFLKVIKNNNHDIHYGHLIAHIAAKFGIDDRSLATLLNV